MDERTAFKPQEIAYRVQNMSGTAKWKRAFGTNQAGFDKLIEKLTAQNAEIETREWDGVR